MRYFYEKPRLYTTYYGKTYKCNHPVYTSCTVLNIGKKGLAIIQQRYDPINKTTWWGELDDWIPDKIYLNRKFKKYFEEKADFCKDGLYPTVTVRQIMWALKMKPLKRERWETVFDRPLI